MSGIDHGVHRGKVFQWSVSGHSLLFNSTERSIEVQHTKIRPKVCASKHPNAQIALDFPHDFDSVIERQMGVLRVCAVVSRAITGDLVSVHDVAAKTRAHIRGSDVWKFDRQHQLSPARPVAGRPCQ